MKLVNPKLGLNFKKEEMITTTNLSLHCTSAIAVERPSILVVVSMLEGRSMCWRVCFRLVSHLQDKAYGIMTQDQVTNFSILEDMPWTYSLL